MCLEKISLDFRTGKGTRDAIGMMRIIAEQTLEIDEELCVCFIDWQKAFDRINWTKLMQLLKRTGIDWRERRLISKLYMEQKVKVHNKTGIKRSILTIKQNTNNYINTSTHPTIHNTNSNQQQRNIYTRYNNKK